MTFGGCRIIRCGSNFESDPHGRVGGTPQSITDALAGNPHATVRAQHHTALRRPHRAGRVVRDGRRATHQPLWAINSTATRARPSGMAIFGWGTWSCLGKNTRKPWGVSHIGPWANPGRHAVSLTS